MSEAKAQAKALKDGYLKRIGEAVDVINPDELPVVERMMYFYGKAFNDAVQFYLNKSGSIASGKIGELVPPKIKKFGNNYEMWLGYDKKNPASVYYDYVNKGVRGVGGENAKPKKIGNTPYEYKTPYPNKKMAMSIERWYKLGKAKVKNESQKYNLKAGQSKNKRLKDVKPKPLTLLHISYMTASAIKRDGLKSTYFFSDAIKEIFDKDFFKTMAVAFGGDMQLQIRQTVNKINKDGNNNK